jgi:hypothetical protein
MSDRSVVVLLGRLGNQLFQFSFARWMQSKGHEVRFDLSAVRRERVALPLRDVIEPLALPTSGLWPAPMGRWGRAALTLRRTIGPRRVVVDTSADGTAATRDPVRPAWWVGYWQQERFTAIARAELRDRLGIAPARVERIAVHVRRGDYVSLGAALPVQWYEQALRAAQAQYGDLPVTVVSDDPMWCRRQFPWPATAFSEGHSTMEDFRALATSEVVIASSSTFSWWASYLGHGTVVRPAGAPPIWKAVAGQEVEVTD